MTVERTYYLFKFLPLKTEEANVNEAFFLRHLYHSDINDLGYSFSGEDVSLSAKVLSEDQIGTYTFNPNRGRMDDTLMEVFTREEINKANIVGDLGLFAGKLLGYRIKYSWRE